MEIKIKKFDLSTIRSDSVIVIIARRNSGKSYLLRQILHQHRTIPIGAVIAPTEESSPFFSSFIPRVFIHPDYDPNVIDKLLKRQHKLHKLADKQKRGLLEGTEYISADKRAMLVLDDANYNNTTWVQDTNLSKIYMNGRHLSMFSVMTLQNAMGLPPKLRAQVDYTFLLRETNHDNQKKLYNNYASCVPTFNMFVDILNNVTVDYGCLVIKNNSRSDDLTDQIYWFKASNPGPFRMMSERYWALSAAIEEESSDDDEPGGDVVPLSRLGKSAFDPNKLTKRTGPQITVRKAK